MLGPMRLLAAAKPEERDLPLHCHPSERSDEIDFARFGVALRGICCLLLLSNNSRSPAPQSKFFQDENVSRRSEG